MMTEKEFEERLVAYFDDDLSAAEKAAVEDYLRVHPQAARQARQLGLLYAGASTAEPDPVPEGVLARANEALQGKLQQRSRRLERSRLVGRRWQVAWGVAASGLAACLLLWLKPEPAPRGDLAAPRMVVYGAEPRYLYIDHQQRVELVDGPAENSAPPGIGDKSGPGAPMPLYKLGDKGTVDWPATVFQRLGEELVYQDNTALPPAVPGSDQWKVAGVVLERQGLGLSGPEAAALGSLADRLEYIEGLSVVRLPGAGGTEEPAVVLLLAAPAVVEVERGDSTGRITGFRVRLDGKAGD
ncbi:MAG: hypothetical protein GKR89_07505 [Candidatus Latescibacteria bacterium]|nr:hypothetical protein [Candidatus Latescibacterota bacterium]